jgi:hypothetical protein
VERIVNAPDHVVRAILIAICNSIPQRSKTLEYLDKITNVESASTASPKKSLKRKAKSEIKICVQCQDAFNEDENDDEACRYHPGMCDPTSSALESFSR